MLLLEEIDVLNMIHTTTESTSNFEYPPNPYDILKSITYLTF